MLTNEQIAQRWAVRWINSANLRHKPNAMYKVILAAINDAITEQQKRIETLDADRE